jgi:hypothetical protein
MLRYEFISRDWIVSGSARRVYRISAVLSILLFFGWIAALSQGGIYGPLAPITKFFFFLGVLGAGITIVGMEFFLFRFDDSHPLKQIFWFCVMLFPILGAAIYCFAVYSRSAVLRSSSAKNEQIV